MEKRGKVLRVALVLLAVLAFLELSHWGDRRISLLSEDTEAILSFCPDVQITEEERDLMEDLLACSPLREAAERGEGVNGAPGEWPEVAALLEERVGKESAAASFLTMHPTGDGTELIWRRDGTGKEQMSLSEVVREDGVSYFKFGSQGSFLGSQVLYENWDNQRARRSLAHHDWLSWLPF